MTALTVALVALGAFFVGAGTASGQVPSECKDGGYERFGFENQASAWPSFSDKASSEVASRKCDLRRFVSGR
jgi:hypothetical protein